MKKTALTTVIILLSIQLFAQKYFQQEVNYKIEVKLNDVEHSLSAFETVEYVNNSPDTLEFIYFHLWANAYKNNKTALAKQMATNGSGKLYFNYKKIGGYIDSLDFKINDKKVLIEPHKKHIDICKLILNEPLLPGESLKITTPFYVKLPGDISRMGHDEQSYQISQWYPKPAVYSYSPSGLGVCWHEMPYLNQGEFYSEFGSFDVSITIPKQYVVGATGNLQNIEELAWLDSLNQTNLRGIDIENPSKEEYKNIRYTENNIHDFAWFANKEYFVDKSEVKLANSDKKITSWTMFVDFYLWEDAVTYVNDAVYEYSQWVGDYPYKNCTAVQGALSAGGGMEYPTITVISAGDDKKSLEEVIMHEVGHNWFYGILGFNERAYPFLDEGLNSFYEVRYMEQKFPESNFGDFFGGTTPKSNKFMNLSRTPYRFIKEFAYDITAHLSIDQPINSHSLDYSGISYFSIAYCKAPVAFYLLQEYLGKEKFDEIMQSFYQKWKFKHPQPNDLENHFRENTDKNLDWFFDDIINSRKKSDYKIKYKNSPLGQGALIVKNKGKINSPFVISGYNDTTLIFTEWYEGSRKKQKIKLPEGNYNKVILDADFATLDFNRYNNYARTKGLFKNTKPLDFNFGSSFNNFDKININYLPVMGWNNQNKLMLGLLVHNYQLPQRKFQYYLMPMYSFSNTFFTRNFTGHFAGEANFSYKMYGYNHFPDITYRIHLQQYRTNETFNGIAGFSTVSENQQRIKTEVDFKLNNLKNSDKTDKHLKVAYYYFPFSLFGIDTYNYLFNVKYSLTKNSLFRPYDFTFNADFNNKFYSVWTEGNYRIHYTSMSSALDIRLFAGTNVSLSGVSGSTDYKYDYTFLSREGGYTNESNIFTQQFIQNYGGFSLHTSNNFTPMLVATNIQSSIYKIPIIKVYSNFALYSNSYNTTIEPIAYEAGFMLAFVKDRFEIYFPLYASKEIWDYNDAITDNYWQKIRFVINFNNIEEYIRKF